MTVSDPAALTREGVARTINDRAQTRDEWQPMSHAPRDGTPILVRRHNDLCWEYFVAWWADDEKYPWRSDYSAYPEHRCDGWLRIPEDTPNKASGLLALSAHPIVADDRAQPRVTDNDAGEISVAFNGNELRGWSYASDDERRIKMLAAREYVEGWCDGRNAK